MSVPYDVPTPPPPDSSAESICYFREDQRLSNSRKHISMEGAAMIACSHLCSTLTWRAGRRRWSQRSELCKLLLESSSGRSPETEQSESYLMSSVCSSHARTHMAVMKKQSFMAVVSNWSSKGSLWLQVFIPTKQEHTWSNWSNKSTVWSQLS